MKYNIVIIDDEVNILKIIEMTLGDEEYNIRTFESATEALDYMLANRQQVDLILSDLYMPDMNGLELLEKVKSNIDLAAVPFIFITAADNETILEEGLKLGAIDFINKPINRTILQNKVKSFLKSFSAASLQQSKMLESDSSSISIDDIIGFCETEKVDGFALIYRKNEYGVIVYEKGLLSRVIYGDLDSDEAFEKLKTWDKFNVRIYRTAYRPMFVKEIFQSGGIVVDEEHEEDGLSGDRTDTAVQKLSTLVNSLEVFVQSPFEKLEITMKDGMMLTLTRESGDLKLMNTGK